MKIKVGVLGATGYTGAELLRLLINHSGVEISWLTSEKFAGRKISEVFPQFRNLLDLQCVKVARLGDLNKVDLVFSCLPHGTSMHFVEKLFLTGARVIDFSADFRLNDPDTYESWYKVKHSSKNLLKEAVYGLPQIFRKEIRDARLVANPGCYATSAIMGLAPLFSKGMIKENSVIVDSKSGLSGGGRAPSLEHHFPESNETASIYGVSGHNQRPEMEQVLSILAGEPVNITFIPHTIPINRGMLTTIYARMKEAKSYDQVLDLYSQHYGGQQFVRIYEKGQFPSVKNVRFSNFCDIGVGFQEDVFISVVALDNLGKGASGQAVQNMNIMFDFPEGEGLNYPGMYP
jgi:N-acetyl-gamma-glutamyl-phosphate reductase